MKGIDDYGPQAARLFFLAPTILPALTQTNWSALSHKPGCVTMTYPYQTGTLSLADTMTLCLSPDPFWRKKMKHTLVAVTGLNPQVVTETLYALNKEGKPWPDELVIITTRQGEMQARMGLLQPRDAGSCMLDKCCADHKHPGFAADAIHFITVKDSAGQPIDDARSRADQEAIADTIVRQVALLCADPERQVHASLAGGRKTMTFYLGYAMSLFARPQDRLSHVLIMPEQYEKLREFYYPTSYTHAIRGHGPNEWLDTHEEHVTVTLADIPFIRQRAQLSKDVLLRFCDDNAQMSYRQLVQLQAVANCTAPYKDVRLEFALPEKQIVIYFHDAEVKRLDMSAAPLELAFFAMIARHNRAGAPGRFCREKGIYDKHATQYRDLYLIELWQILYPHEPIPAVDEIYNVWSGNTASRKENTIKAASGSENKTIEGLKNPVSTFFDDRKANLKKQLEKSLPKDLVRLLEPTTVFSGEQGECRTSLNDSNSLPKSKLLGLKVSSNLCSLDEKCCS